MTEPTPAELSRRFDEMRQEIRDSFRDIKKDLAEVPSLQAISALLEVRDTRISAQDKRLDELTGALSAEVSNRQAADRDLERDNEKRIEQIQTRIEGVQARIETGRRWLIGTIIAAAGTLFGIMAWIYEAGGAAT